MQHAQDYFVVSSCKILIKLSEKFPEKKKFVYEPVIQDTENELVLDEEKEMLSWDNSNQVITLIFNYINEKSVYGATSQDLKNKFDSQENENFDNLLEIVEKLLEKNLIFRVGVVQTRFVSKNHLKPWILKSFDLKRRHQENAGNIKFACKDYDQAKTNEIAKSVDNIDWSRVDMINILSQQDS